MDHINILISLILIVALDIKKLTLLHDFKNSNRMFLIYILNFIHSNIYDKSFWMKTKLTKFEITLHANCSPKNRVNQNLLIFRIVDHLFQWWCSMWFLISRVRNSKSVNNFQILCSLILLFCYGYIRNYIEIYWQNLRPR